MEGKVTPESGESHTVSQASSSSSSSSSPPPPPLPPPPPSSSSSSASLRSDITALVDWA